MSNKIFKSLIIAITFVLITNSYLFIKPANLGGAWMTPIQISPNSGMGAAQRSQVAFDCSGDAIALWDQFDSVIYKIYANRYDATAGSWQTTTSTDYISSNTGAGASAIAPQLAVACSGDVIAVWHQRDFSGTGTLRVYANRYDATTDSWQTAELISSTTIDGDARGAAVAIDCQGNAIAVWRQRDFDATGTYRIYANRYNSETNAWDSPPSVPISNDNPGQDNANNPQIAIACSGYAIAVWQQYDDDVSTGTQRIYTNRYNPSTNSWQTTADQISPNSTLADATNPQIAIDCQGNAFAVWMQDDGTGTVEIYVNRYNVSSVWQTAINLTQNLTGNFANPQIAIDCKGNAIAIWNQAGGAVYARRYDAASMSWHANPVAISSSSGGPELAQIAFDCQGNAFAVWIQNDGSNLRIYANRYNVSSGSWLGAVTISPAGVDADIPQIAIDCQGNAMAVWEQSNQIYAAYFDAVPAPSNISGSQESHRFATQANLTNRITWRPVRYQNQIVKYKIGCISCAQQEQCCSNCCNCLIRCCTCPCVDASLIGEVSAASSPVFYHHGRCCGQCTTYCLTAVDNQGNETPVPGSITVP